MQKTARMVPGGGGPRERIPEKAEKRTVTGLHAGPPGCISSDEPGEGQDHQIEDRGRIIPCGFLSRLASASPSRHMTAISGQECRAASPAA
jgi:hypothetical protein